MENEFPFFSVIIPTYNRAGFIGKTIRSLLDQVFNDFEIIVVDDGSTDSTAEVMKNFVGGKTSYHQKNNAERAAARNFGARLAKGTYVNFFDSDDVAYRGHLQTAFTTLNRFSQPEIFHLGYDTKDSEGNLLSETNHLQGKDLNSKLIHGNVLSCNGVFLRRDIVLQHPFNEDRILSASEDYELWLRLAARYPVLYDNTITSTVINHDARSVLVINKDALIRRQKAFIQHLFADPVSAGKYAPYRSLLIANAHTYIALHLALTKKHRKEVIAYLWKAFTSRPAVVSRRRFWASLKHIL